MESPGEVVLKDLIQHYCSNFLYENAKFFAERLYYGNPNSDQMLKSEYLFLLAKCYHGQGKVRQVYHLLKEDTYLPNRYLFAQSCIALSKYPDAEKALFPFKNIHPNEITEKDLAFIPGGAAGLYLLGVICRHEQRKDYAIAYFQQTITVSIYIYIITLHYTTYEESFTI
jgi:anaphase-promoting complex subunit 3